MANSYQEYTSGLTGTSFTGFNVKSISQGHLKVATSTDNGTTYTTGALTVTVNGTTATTSSAPSTGSDGSNKIRIYRSTGTAELVDFQSGARITESDLDTSYQHAVYAAQEVLENASGAPLAQQGSAGAAGVGIQSISSNKVGLNTTVTITKTDGSTSSFVISDGAAGAAGAAGTDGANATNAGSVLETFTMPCDGSQITVGSGTYTLPDQDAAVNLTTAYADVAASQIAYTPPTGAQLVIYEFRFACGRGDDDPIGHFKLFIDGTEVSDARTTVYQKGGSGGHNSIKWGFLIGGGTSAPLGKVASWTSAKTIKIQAREYDGSSEATLYNMHHWNGSGSDQFTRPLLSITAIR